MIQSLERDELERLFAAAAKGKELHRLMFAVTFNHGLRVSELLALTPDNLDNGQIDVRRLKGSKRTIHALVDAPGTLFDEKKPLFALAQKCTGKQRLFPFTRRWLDKLIKRYGAIAGIPLRKRHMHALKHTTCTYGVDSVGVPMTRTYVGHKSGASTLEYAEKSAAVANPAVQAALRG